MKRTSEGGDDTEQYTFWSQVEPLFGETLMEAVVKQRSSATTPSSGKPRKRRQTKKSVAPTPVNPELGTCPKCHKALVARKSKHGEFIGCSGFPTCRFTKNLS